MHQLIIRLILLSATVLAMAAPSNPVVAGKARFTVISPELVRMEYAVDGKFVDEPTLFATQREARCADFSVEEEGPKVVITTPRLRLKYTSDGRPFSQMNIEITVFRKTKNAEWRIYSEDDQNLGGPAATLDEGDGAIPVQDGLLSRNGWHVVDDSGKEILKDDWVSERPVNHLKDLYFFAYDTDYKAALRALATIGGPVPMTRKYVHGSWYCRWWNYTADDYRKLVQEYKEHDFPLDVMVMDMGWHTQKEATTGAGHAGMYGWTGYTWNRKLIPDPPGLLSELKKDGIAVSLNDHPHDGIRTHEAGYASFTRAMGEDPACGKELLFNAGDQRYMEAFFAHALKPLEKDGVDFWWLDWQQDYLYPHVLGFRNLRHLDWLNHLYYQHSEADGKRGLHFSRWGGWGSHRTPIQFSGDTVASWASLAFQVPFTANSGNAGCFFWAHDVGGFMGDRNPELYVRWTQFALTTSSLRIHSVNDPQLDRRPWLWGAEEEAALRKVYHLRSRLMPYIYSSVSQCHFQTLPLNRPMYLEYPEAEAAYQNAQEFLFGDLLLSAPVASPGQGSERRATQRVWFPAGDDWFDLLKGTRHAGGSQATVEATLQDFPLFVKGGCPLPMQPLSQRMATAPLSTLVLCCYPGMEGRTGTFELYEHDGISRAYEKGACARTPLSYQKKGGYTTIRVGATLGRYDGQVLQRACVIELPGVLHPRRITVDGRPVKFTVDPDSGTTIQIPAGDIRKGRTVVVDEPEDPSRSRTPSSIRFAD